MKKEIEKKIEEIEKKIENFEEKNKMGYWNDDIHDLEIELKVLKELQKGMGKSNHTNQMTAKGFSKAIDKSGLRGFRFEEDYKKQVKEMVEKYNKKLKEVLEKWWCEDNFNHIGELEIMNELKKEFLKEIEEIK